MGNIRIEKEKFPGIFFISRWMFFTVELLTAECARVYMKLELVKLRFTVSFYAEYDYQEQKYHACYFLIQMVMSTV